MDGCKHRSECPGRAGLCCQPGRCPRRRERRARPCGPCAPPLQPGWAAGPLPAGAGAVCGVCLAVHRRGGASLLSRLVRGSGAPALPATRSRPSGPGGQSLSFPGLRLAAVHLGALCPARCAVRWELVCAEEMGGQRLPLLPARMLHQSRPEPASWVLPFPPARARLPRERPHQPGSHTLALCLALAAAGGERAAL